jgi:enoyl-CoA hydratase
LNASGNGRKETVFSVETVNGVAHVSFTTDTPGNVLGANFWRELPVVFGRLSGDSSVRVIVLSAHGPQFSYGIDLKAMPGMFGDAFSHGGLAAARLALRSSIIEVQDAISSLAACAKPVVAAVHGWCVGGALDLIAAADVRYASADARFSVREVRVGIVADLGILQRLPALIGDGFTRELALTGDDISADEAARVGLVNTVLPDRDSLLAHAHTVAERIADNPPRAVQGVKHVLNSATTEAVSAGLRYVATWNSAFLPSADVNEAIAALFEKRTPIFTGE